MAIQIGTFRARRIHFGEGDDAWSFPDPEFADAEAMTDALHYLTSVCPDTRTACDKLASVRRAVKNRPVSPTPTAVPGRETE